MNRKTKLVEEKNIVKKGIVLADMTKVPKIRLSFKLYEEKYQKVKMEDLNQKQAKQFVDLVGLLHKEDITYQNGKISLNRGPLKKDILKDKKLKQHELVEDMIHLGKAKKPFRLHGVLKSNIFYLICIDPNHEVHPE